MQLAHAFVRSLAVWLQASAAALDKDDTAGVDATDYDRWKANFGRTLAIASGGRNDISRPVPEPIALVLLLPVIAVLRRWAMQQRLQEQPTSIR